MKVLVDMNLSPSWVGFLGEHGYSALHWSMVGAATAPDAEVLEWASRHGYIVYSHDLDMSAILAATGALRPSVVQIRTTAPVPSAVGSALLSVLRLAGDALRKGAVVTFDARRSRVRMLPLRGDTPGLERQKTTPDFRITLA